MATFVKLPSGMLINIDNVNAIERRGDEKKHKNYVYVTGDTYNLSADDYEYLVEFIRNRG